MPSVSIILPTFNRAGFLRRTIDSVHWQTYKDWELIIADDGSAPGTAALVERHKMKVGVPLAHVWQEHRDFRAGEIRNRAIRVSRGAYVVFLDGDCLARPDFIATHRRLAEPGWFVTGNRALLTEGLTDAVLSQPLEPEHWGMADWLRQRLCGGLNRLGRCGRYCSLEHVPGLWR